MANEEKQEVAVEAPVKKKSMVKIIIIAVVALAVVAGGVVAAMHFLGKGGAEKKPAPAALPAVKALWPMDYFLVNLQDPERYLRVVIQLEVSDQSAVAELEQRKPYLRDKFVTLLRAKTYAELKEPSGEQQLRDELLIRGNSVLTKGKITAVLFTEFVVQ